MRKAVPILVVVAGLGLYVYFFHVVPARELDPTVRGTGTVEYVDVALAPEIPGRIETIAAQEGDEVKRGDVLVTIECDAIEAQVAQAEAQVEAARAAVAQAEAAAEQARAAARQARAGLEPLRVALERAERERSRAVELERRGGIPGQVADEAGSTRDAASEQLAAAREGVAVAARGAAVAERAEAVTEAQLALAERAVDLARVRLDSCSLEAPMDGVVLRRNHEPGEMALAGAAVLRIGRRDRVHTWVYVANEDVGRVRVGQRVRVAADTYPGREFDGEVVRVNEEAEFTPKTIQTRKDRTRLVYGVKVAIPNPDGALMAGMPVEAILVEDHSAGAGDGSR